MPAMNLSNGTIENISSDRGTMFVTVTYRRGLSNRRTDETVRLVVTPRTVIFHTNGVPVSATALRVGMTINATFSSAMTRSIPPQATAYTIWIIRNPQSDNIIIGRILDINRNDSNFTTISDRDTSTIIRFNVSNDTMIFDRFGRPMRFSGLSSGMRVQVRHANFLTASIPPQTTAFEIRVL